MIVKYFAWLKIITEIDQEIIEDTSVIDVKTLMEFLLKKYPKLKTYIESKDLIRIAINHSYTFDNDKIQENDEVALFPPVSGG